MGRMNRKTGMISVSVDGDFSKTEKFFEQLKQLVKIGELDKYGRMGVEALARATPKDTGETSESWSYKILNRVGAMTIVWENDKKTSDGTPIVVLIQYGHGLKNGGYVKARDFINPALRPVFDKIADEVWKEVTKV